MVHTVTWSFITKVKDRRMRTSHMYGAASVIISRL